MAVNVLGQTSIEQIKKTLPANETADTQALVSKYGYRYYTSTEKLKNYIEATHLK